MARQEVTLPPCPSAECAATGCDCMIEDHHNPGACSATFGFKVCVLADGHAGMHESKSRSSWGNPHD